MTTERLPVLCRFLAEISFSSVPTHVIHHTKLVLLDTLGVVIAGSETPEVKQTMKMLGPWHGTEPGVSCPGQKGGFQPLFAVMANGMAGSSLEFEEGNSMAMGHPAIQIVPAVVAEAEGRGLNGESLLRGLLCGYEMASRLSCAASMRKGLHPTGTWGIVGSAAGVACAGGRNGEALFDIANMAASYAFSPYVKNSFVGKNVACTFAGMANLSGFLAVLYHDAGIRADEGCLEMTFSRFLSEGFDEDRLVEGLGRQFAITQNYFKPYPTCRFNHPALDALRAILDKTPIHPEEVTAISVTSFRAAVHGGSDPPPNAEAMRFSTPYLLGAMIRYGRVDLGTLGRRVLEDPVVRDLAARVGMSSSTEYEGLRSARSPAKVTVRLRDGRELTHELMNALGDPSTPMPDQAVFEKFLSLSVPVIGRKRAEEGLERIRNLDNEQNVRSVMSLLRAGE
jgi:2-methylcitrate dehydratase PrpD